MNYLQVVQVFIRTPSWSIFGARQHTGHEMLDQVELVHMNGRIYDPITARFLSGDPLIQDPINGQNYNRYSYVLNNPTNLTDPTGFLTTVEISGRAAREAMIAAEEVIQRAKNTYSEYQRVQAVAAQRAAFARYGKIILNFGVRSSVFLVSAITPSNWAQNGCQSGDLCAPDPVTGELTRAAWDNQILMSAGEQSKNISDAVSTDPGEIKKRGPKTDPDAPHNKKIREIAEKELAANPGARIVSGGGVEPEQLIKTPSGIKEGRRPDIIIEYPDGTQKAINIGRTTSKGLPVKREREAMQDLNQNGNLPTKFIPYDK